MSQDLQNRIDKAIELLQEPCGSCKDCKVACPLHIIVKVLRGQPATICPCCDEWWNGPIEYDFSSIISEIKMAECPKCGQGQSCQIGNG